VIACTTKAKAIVLGQTRRQSGPPATGRSIQSRSAVHSPLRRSIQSSKVFMVYRVFLTLRVRPEV
jgi:hypothetical protein